MATLKFSEFHKVMSQLFTLSKKSRLNLRSKPMLDSTKISTIDI